MNKCVICGIRLGEEDGYMIKIDGRVKGDICDRCVRGLMAFISGERASDVKMPDDCQVAHINRIERKG